MSETLDILGATKATTEAVKAALAKATTNGFTLNTGASGIDLAPFVSLVPVDTPYYDTTPRTPVAQGSDATIWQTYANSNQAQSYGFTAGDSSAALMVSEIINQQTQMARTGIRNLVTLDVIGQAQGYVDAYAEAALQAINQKLIQEDILLLNGLTYSIGTVPAPTLTTAGTGGTIAASTAVDVQVAAISGLNYYSGGSTAATAVVSITTGTATTNTVTASISAPPALAVGYEWFVNGYYYTTTSVPTVTITSIPTANQAVPTTPDLPLLYGAGTVAITAIPSTDTSYATNGFTGLVGSIVADLSSEGTINAPATYVTPGTGLSQGAYKENLAGGQLHYDGPQIVEWNEVLLSIYATWQLSPSRILVAPQQFNDVSTTILGTPNAVNFFNPTSVEQHRGLVAAGSVPIYVNPTTGSPAQIQVMPHLPPGVVVFVSDQVPFPGSNIGWSQQVRTLYDNFLFSYGTTSQPSSGPSGPRWEFEIRSDETFVNYGAPMMGVLSGIAPGVAAA